jgi:hypothetical protein
LKKIFPFPENPGGKTQKATEGVNFPLLLFYLSSFLVMKKHDQKSKTGRLVFEGNLFWIYEPRQAPTPLSI